MKNFFNRGWFRTEIYVRNTPQEFLSLAEELNTQIKALYKDNDFNNLSDTEKTKVLDQFRTALQVTWERTKKLVSDTYLTCREDEKAFYTKRTSMRTGKDALRKFYNKNEFEAKLAEVKENKERLDLIISQLSILDEVLQNPELQEYHVLEQRKVKDGYISSITLCWKHYITTIINENQLMSDYTKAIKKKEHILERRRRHADRGVKKATFKKTRNQLIEEMLSLPDDEFERVQAELEREYRRLRNLPDVPEV